jgi:hypothetical protein
VKAPPARSNPGKVNVTSGAPTVTILFIALSTAQYKLEADWAEAGGGPILRLCPVCLCKSIIGHGRRRKQAHDEDHDWIKIRRGRCNLCAKTLRYLKITQPDLQREFHQARQNTAQTYSVPSLAVPAATADLPGIRHALAAARHLLEMYRRQLSNDKTQRRLQRLDRRLLDVDQTTPEHRRRRKMRKDWPVNRWPCVK